MEDQTMKIDPQKYNVLFEDATRQFPDVDPYFINVAVLSHLYNPEKTIKDFSDIGKDVKNTYSTEDLVEGISNVEISAN